MRTKSSNHSNKVKVSETEAEKPKKKIKHSVPKSLPKASYPQFDENKAQPGDLVISTYEAI